jgi:hypothetical protein
MNPLSALERYALFALIIALSLGGAYFKGRHDKAAEDTKTQLAADAAELQMANAAMLAREAADDAARARAETFMANVDRGLAHVQDQFGKLPQVVVDARGCADLSGNFGLRWNAAAGSVSGASGPPTGSVSPSGVQPDALPATGGPR